MIILSHTIPSIELASYNIPIVTIEREDQYVSSVNTDNYMGGVQATSLLAKTGACLLYTSSLTVFPDFRVSCVACISDPLIMNDWNHRLFVFNIIKMKAIF